MCIHWNGTELLKPASKFDSLWFCFDNVYLWSMVRFGCLYSRVQDSWCVSHHGRTCEPLLHSLSLGTSGVIVGLLSLRIVEFLGSQKLSLQGSALNISAISGEFENDYE